MKIKRYLFVIVSTLILSLLLVTPVLASGWYGPNYYSTSDVNSHAWGTMTIYPANRWYEYWDDSENRFTQYKILDTCQGQIYVASGSSSSIYVEKAWLHNYQGTAVSSYTWYDTVDAGESWIEYFPFSDTTLTKLEDPNEDGTNISWGFVWTYIVFPGGHPQDDIMFLFSIKEWVTD